LSYTKQYKRQLSLSHNELKSRYRRVDIASIVSNTQEKEIIASLSSLATHRIARLRFTLHRIAS
jgi:hypothetical protein